LIATHNKGKVAEYADILDGQQFDWLTLDDARIAGEVEETGATFRENAILKAQAYARQSGLLTLADDSGLEVDALGGRPGVLTARYGGPGLSYAERYGRLLAELIGIPWDRRTARFHCVVALASPDSALLGTADGVCEGYVALEPAGDGGFGYDPVFFLPELGLTMAQLPPETKHAISHRGRAVRAIAPLLQSLI
jgi:XTP/dITP diphosphohydrolase